MYGSSAFFVHETSVYSKDLARVVILASDQFVQNVISGSCSILFSVLFWKTNFFCHQVVFDYEDQMKIPFFKKHIEDLTSEAVRLRFFLFSS